MPEEKTVPTGPQNMGVNVSLDAKRPVTDANAKPGKNVDPNSNRDKDGIRTFGGGGTKVELLVDYWPQEQPETPPGALAHRENRCAVGEVVSLPSDEAMDLIEEGKAKRAKEPR